MQKFSAKIVCVVGGWGGGGGEGEKDTREEEACPLARASFVLRPVFKIFLCASLRA